MSEPIDQRIDVGTAVVAGIRCENLAVAEEVGVNPWCFPCCSPSWSSSSSLVGVSSPEPCCCCPRLIAISRGQQQQGSGDDTPTRDEDEDQEGEQHGKHHGFTPTSSATARFSQRIPATTAVPTSILWSMGSDIENAEEIKAWHQNIWMLFNYLFLRIAGVATSFLLRYKPKSGEIPNGKAAWDCMIA